MEKKLRVMVIGAHPDDCELVGGIILKFVKQGHTVKFLSATNGYSGHHVNMGAAITAIRWDEAKKVAALAKIEYDFLDNNDGYLTAGLPERQSMLRAIRSFAPDLIFTHRPNDYHPDHRNTSILVQDCSYLVQVPNVCAMTPVLRYQPAIFYMPDNFTKPYSFTPDIVFDISDVIEEKMRLYHQYTSQMYEWLPWVENKLETVPEDDEARFRWLMDSKRTAMFAAWAEKWREKLIAKYGEPGKTAKYAEALEICEYGGRLTPEQLSSVFSF